MESEPLTPSALRFTVKNGELAVYETSDGLTWTLVVRARGDEVRVSPKRLRDAERALADELAEALIHCAPAKFAARDAALAKWEAARTLIP